MSRSSEYVVQRALPGVAEALRAVSGLVAILVLGIMVMQMTLAGAGNTGEVQRVEPAAPHAREKPAGLLVEASEGSPVMLFFLVTTPEQERLAGLAEAETHYYLREGEIPPRSFEVLYARSEEELRQAGEIILQRSLALPASTLVKVADLRSVESVH